MRRSAGHVEGDRADVLVRANDAGERLHLEHAVDVAREAHLHGVGVAVGDGLHADHRLAFVDDLDAPVHALLAAGLDADLLGRGRRRATRVPPSSSSETVHLLQGLEVVVDDGGEDDLVLLDEEARGFEAHQEVFLGDDLGLALSDLGAVAQRPDLDLPGGEVFGHGQADLGGSVRIGGHSGGPEGGVGEVLANRRLDPGRAGRSRRRRHPRARRRQLASCRFSTRRPPGRLAGRGRRPVPLRPPSHPARPRRPPLAVLPAAVAFSASPWLAPRRPSRRRRRGWTCRSRRSAAGCRTSVPGSTRSAGSDFAATSRRTPGSLPRSTRPRCTPRSCRKRSSPSSLRTACRRNRSPSPSPSPSDPACTPPATAAPPRSAPASPAAQPPRALPYAPPLPPPCPPRCRSWACPSAPPRSLPVRSCPSDAPPWAAGRRRWSDARTATPRRRSGWC